MKKVDFERSLESSDLSLVFREDIFKDKTKKWSFIQNHKWLKLGTSSSDARSRYIIENDRIFCETEARGIKASPQQLVDLIYMVEWTWWKHSKVLNTKKDGEKWIYDFYPTGSFVKVQETMFKPITIKTETAEFIRIPIFMEGDCEGIAHFDIFKDEENPGMVRLFGRFVNVSTTFSWLLGGVEGFCRNHLNCELGRLHDSYYGFGMIMFPSQTGWVGLAELLEKEKVEEVEGEED